MVLYSSDWSDFDVLIERNLLIAGKQPTGDVPGTRHTADAS